MSEEETQIALYIKQIRSQVEFYGLDFDDAVQAVKSEAAAFGLPEDSLQRIDTAASRYSEEKEQVEYLKVTALRRRDREPWYGGPNEDEGYWPGLRDYLLNEKEWEEEPVQKIHDSSTRIVSLLDNPGLRRKLSIKFVSWKLFLVAFLHISVII